MTRFNEILDRFMETFVAPRMAAAEGDEVAEVSNRYIPAKNQLLVSFLDRLPERRNHEGSDAGGSKHDQLAL